MAKQSANPLRPLLEAGAGFLAALVLIPLAFKTIGGLFRLGIVRKLIGEAIFIGLTTALTNEGTLDKLFGKPGRRGDGALKP